jgi:hypothetical protein
MEMTVFWDIAPCSLAVVDRRFRLRPSGRFIALMMDARNVGLLQRDYTALYT